MSRTVPRSAIDATGPVTVNPERASVVKTTMVAMATTDGRLASGPGPMTNRTNRAVFLCYHSVHPDGPPYISVTPEALEEHLVALRRLGYRSGGEADLDAMREGREADALAFLTFDDGYLDNYERALPRLRDQDMKGIFFVLPDQIGRERLDWPEAREYAVDHPAVMRPMTWPMLEELVQDGHVIGSHTHGHQHLRELGDEELTQVLVDSRRVLVDRLGGCDLFAYPYGEWDLRVALAAAAAGYRYAFTLPPSSRHVTPMSIPRLSVDHRDTGMRFVVKLRPTVRALAFSRAAADLRRARIRLRELGSR
jgi:peptidoglycan/xylan/chitin deacetylase (PgdA/CDA1 family)